MIVNADDFGHDPDSVNATIACFEAGAVTSATIMPNMAATDEAVTFALANPRFSFGAHLTFAGKGSERPVSDPAEVPDLVDGSGRFLSSRRVRRRALLGQIPRDQVEHEVRAQLDRLRGTGLSISHVDSHCHLHKFPPFIGVLSSVLPDYGIFRVRTAQDTYLRRAVRSPTYWLGPRWQGFIRDRFRTTDHFYMPACQEDARRMAELATALAEGTTEVGCHPGAGDGWRNSERLGVQEFSKAAREAGHELVTWQDV